MVHLLPPQEESPARANAPPHHRKHAADQVPTPRDIRGTIQAIRLSDVHPPWQPVQPRRWPRKSCGGLVARHAEDMQGADVLEPELGEKPRTPQAEAAAAARLRPEMLGGRQGR
ncbi:hypothetical protein SASPL_150166 [Salvia splendens]|uniref:Uncharacterized protein n=1 Tax=Salvia splendens TaxID=180675 RepID=A0A8X8W6R3_SALSN|nr:hypothetical protein SASPL_150166 [Salvia splendens]